jgi:hypothetical protein
MESQTQDLDRWQVPAGTNSHTIRIKSLAIVEDNQAIYDETSLLVEIDDKGAGEFIALSSPTGETKLEITVEQWPVVRDAIDFMAQHCRSDKEIS